MLHRYKKLVVGPSLICYFVIRQLSCQLSWLSIPYSFQASELVLELLRDLTYAKSLRLAWQISRAALSYNYHLAALLFVFYT